MGCERRYTTVETVKGTTLQRYRVSRIGCSSVINSTWNPAPSIVSHSAGNVTCPPLSIPYTGATFSRKILITSWYARRKAGRACVSNVSRIEQRTNENSGWIFARKTVLCFFYRFDERYYSRKNKWTGNWILFLVESRMEETYGRFLRRGWIYFGQCLPLKVKHSFGPFFFLRLKVLSFAHGSRDKSWREGIFSGSQSSLSCVEPVLFSFYDSNALKPTESLSFTFNIQFENSVYS